MVKKRLSLKELYSIAKGDKKSCCTAKGPKEEQCCTETKSKSESKNCCG